MLRLLHSMRGRHDWRGQDLKRALAAFKYFVRAASMARAHDDYLASIGDDPLMHAYRRRDPRVQERHFHRYLNLHWDRHARLRAMRMHYRLARAAMPPALFRGVYADGNALLGTLALKDGRRAILSLRPPILRGCEGELCIQLGDELGNPWYRIVATAIDEHTLAIGCLQGPDGSEAREAVRELTRNLHGMRPKCLMLALARALARHWGLVRVLAVGNAAHPLRKVRKRFMADYDAYWREQQGRDVGDGWFELPASPERKSEAEVPSRHRSAFRRREALRMDAERLLIGALGAAVDAAGLRTARQGLPHHPETLQAACIEAS